MTPSTTDPAGLIQAIQRYFDLLHDFDALRYDQVFRASATLHGVNAAGAVTVFTAAAFKAWCAGQPTPESRNEPRQEQVLLIDFASPDQAMVKVRVRMNATVYLDHLIYHRVDGAWWITAKAFHVERDAAATVAA